MTHTDEKHDRKHEPGRSIAARFESKAEAREAIAALHKAHFTHTWLGTTSVAVDDVGDETVTVESGGFFSHTSSLVDALVSHGVLGDTAREIERNLEPGDAIVTVDPKDHDVAEATSILEQHGGRLAGNAGLRGDFWTTPSQARASTRTALDPDDVYAEEDMFYQRTPVRR